MHRGFDGFSTHPVPQATLFGSPGPTGRHGAREGEPGDRRGPSRGQGQRVPGGADARGRPGAHRRGAHRPAGGGRGGGLRAPRGTIRTGRGQVPVEHRRGVAGGRSRPQGQGARRGGVRQDARGADPVHVPPPRREPRAHRGTVAAQGVRGGVRDRAGPRGPAAVARPDERGGGPHGTARRGAPVGEGVRGPRHPDGWGVRCPTGQGARPRGRDGRVELGVDRSGDGGRGGRARQEPRQAARPTGSRWSNACESPTW